MKRKTLSTRRAFVVCCACVAGCAGLAQAASPSSRNTKSVSNGASSEGPSDAKKSFDMAYCGIYCAACELHLKENKEGKKCKGCTHPSKESKCEVFICAKEKKVANCGLCESFESCEKLKKHHEKPLYRQVARRTCSKIKESGLAAAIAEQKTRWTCKSCGKLYPWNTKGVCPHCGKPVDTLSEKDA